MVLLLLLPSASADTLTVGALGYPSIQAAVDAAVGGDTVVVEPGTWAGTVDFRGKALTLRSRDGAATTFLVGGAGAWTVVLAAGEGPATVLDGFTITNPGGAGVYVGGGARPTLRNLSFDGNGALGSWTPALQVSGAEANIADSSFTGNGSQYGGAVLVDNGSLTLDRVSFAGDSAWAGGAMFLSTAGVATIRDCTFTGEEATDSGGALYVAATASASVASSSFDGNQAAAGRGGAFYVTGGSVGLDTVTFSSNYANQGGAGWLSDGSVLDDQGSLWDQNTSYDVGGALVGYGTFTATQENATFSENLSTYSHGGAVYGGTYGTYSCTGCTFTGNTAYYYGGAAFFSELYGSATFTDTSFDQNRGTYGYGGGVYAQYWSDLYLSGTTWTSNQAYSGGAVYAYYRTDLAAADSSFTGNVAEIYAGGAIVVADEGLSDSGASLDRVELADNRSENEGGAVSIRNVQTASVNDSRFLRNSAGPASFGGALFVRDTNTLVATRNDLASNTAGYGGAVYVDTPGRGATLLNNRFVENAAGVGGAFCVVGGGGEAWTNNTFVGNGASEAGGVGCVHGTTVHFRNNVVAWTDPGAAIHDYSAETAAKADYAYNAWFENLAGDTSGEAGAAATAQGSLAKDPRLVAYTRDGDTSDDNLRLLRDSPLLDAGDPALLDPDGSRSDIGAYGGPAAPAGDADADGFDASADCDDADASVHPGATETWYDGVNQDCTGASDYDQDGDGVEAADHGGADCDDTDPASSHPCADPDSGDPDSGGAPGGEPGGCGCGTGAAPTGMGLLLVAAALAGRRRR